MSNIPDHFIAFGEAVAKLAREAGFTGVGISIRPGYDDSWRDNVTVSWEQGRHGAEAGSLVVQSTVVVRHRIDESSAPQGNASLGIPSCGKPLCSENDHHPLCPTQERK